MGRRLFFSIFIIIAGLSFSSSAQAQQSWRNLLPTWLGGTEPPPPARPRPRPATVTCLGSTSTQDLSIENALRDPLQPSYAYSWSRPGTQERFLQACTADFSSGTPLTQQNLRLAGAGANLGQLHLNRTCIRQAIRIRANDNISGTRNLCAPRARQMNSTPCLSDRFVDFVTYTINSAIRCLSARDNILEPDTVFEMINNESAFIGNIHSSRGVGMFQMTSAGVREIFGTNEAGRAHLDSMMARPQKRGFCEAFRRLVQPIDDRRIDACNYTGPDDGIARSALAGIGLLSYYQTVARETIANAGIRRNNPRFETIARQFALVAYNAGMTNAQTLLSKLGARAVGNSPDPVTMIRNGAKRWIGNEYLSAMKTRRAEIPGLPPTCSQIPGASR